MNFKNLISRAKESPLTAFTLSSAVAQVFPFVSAPILTRLYSPAAFGNYAIYTALSTTLGTLALFSLNNAVLLEKQDEDAYTSMLAGLVPAVLFSSALMIALLTMQANFELQLLAGLDQLILFVPCTILLSSAYVCGYTWLLRLGDYRRLAINKLVLALATTLLQIGIGLLQLETLGFVLANLAGYVLATLLVYQGVLKDDRFRFRLPSPAELVAVFRRHRATALLTTPASLLNTACSYLPDLLLGKFYGPTVLGHFSLGMRVVALPLNFISTTVQDVFRREAAREHAVHGTCKKSFSKFFGLLAAVSLFLLGPLIWAVPHVFTIVFGDQWGPSGTYLQCMAILLMVRFVSSPLSYVWIVSGKQRFDMLWQVGLLVLVASAFLAPRLTGILLSAEQQLSLYSAIVGAWYVVALILSFHWSRAK